MAVADCMMLQHLSKVRDVTPLHGLQARWVLHYKQTHISIAGPRVWNTLHASVPDTISSLRFRKLMKAFLFVWRPRRRWHWTGALKWTHLLTYLLTLWDMSYHTHTQHLGVDPNQLSSPQYTVEMRVGLVGLYW